MVEPKPTITAEALALCRYHPFGGDEHFLVALSEALARLHPTAPNAERIAILNKTTAEHAERLDADAIAKAHAEGAAAERERIAAILGSREAEGRGDTARSLAFNSDLPAEAAIAALKAAPKSSALDAWSQQPAPALTPEIEAALQARAEGLGLQAPDGTYTTLPVQPAPAKAAASGAKALWRKTIAEVNASSGSKPAKAG